MDAKTFISNYPKYIELIGKVVSPEYQHILKQLHETDPHELIKPEYYFNSEAEAISIVFQLFAKEIKKKSPRKMSKKERQIKLEQEIEAAKQLLASNGIQSQGLWCLEDIIDKAKELKTRCNRKDALEILANIEHDFVAEYGISWNTIENTLHYYTARRK
jgi:hypothetical protein